MGTIKGFLIIGTHKDVKYYYRPTTESWTPHLNEVQLGDIKQEKIEIDMADHPTMDSYSHQEITISGNTDY